MWLRVRYASIVLLMFSFIWQYLTDNLLLKNQCMNLVNQINIFLNKLQQCITVPVPLLPYFVCNDVVYTSATAAASRFATAIDVLSNINLTLSPMTSYHCM